MATQLQIVNKVMRRLREDQIGGLSTSTYGQLIGSFLNDAKEDMEDVWFWSVNEVEIDTSILSDGTRTYDLTSTTDRSFMLRNVADKLPMAYDITAGQEAQLQDIPYKQLRVWRNTYQGTPPTDGRPTFFSIVPDSDGRGYTLEMMQGSSTARTWRTYWYAPQAELVVTGADDDTVILLPERPLYLKTLYYAMNERGEEMGEPGHIMEKKADDALAAAIELDTQVNKKSDEKDMTNVELLRTQQRGDYL